MKPDDLYSVPGIPPVDEAKLIEANQKLSVLRKAQAANSSPLWTRLTSGVYYVVILCSLLLASWTLLYFEQLVAGLIAALLLIGWLFAPGFDTWRDARSEVSGDNDDEILVGRLERRNARGKALEGYSQPILHHLLQERQLLHRSKALLLGGLFRVLFGATATPVIVQLVLRTKDGSAWLEGLPLLPIGSFVLGILVGLMLLWFMNAQSQRILEAEMEAICDAIVACKQEDEKNARVKVKPESLLISSTNKLTNGHTGLPQNPLSIQRIISRLSRTSPKP